MHEGHVTLKNMLCMFVLVHCARGGELGEADIGNNGSNAGL